MSSNVYKFPDQEQVTGTACEYLARLERGLTAQEHQDLRAWLDESPAHAKALVEVAKVWDQMDSLSRLSELFPKVARGTQTRHRIAMGIAATLLIAITSGLVAIGYQRRQELSVSLPSESLQEQLRQSATDEYRRRFQTAIGERSTIRLPDGSELLLNTNSRVYADFSGNARKLTLEQGELYVRVAHDPVHPLTVRAADKVVRAVGTEFNVVIAQNQDVEVIVTQGKVLIGVTERSPAPQAAGGKDAEIPVVAGERILLNSEKQVVNEINADELTVKLSWRDGNIIFRGEPLAIALNEIEKYTPVEFLIQDEQLKTIRVAGLFKAGDVDGLLATLKQNFNISYERAGQDTIVLKSN